MPLNKVRLRNMPNKVRLRNMIRKSSNKRMAKLKVQNLRNDLYIFTLPIYILSILQRQCLKLYKY